MQSIHLCVVRGGGPGSWATYNTERYIVGHIGHIGHIGWRRGEQARGIGGCWAWPSTGLDWTGLVKVKSKLVRRRAGRQRLNDDLYGVFTHTRPDRHHSSPDTPSPLVTVSKWPMVCLSVCLSACLSGSRSKWWDMARTWKRGTYRGPGLPGLPGLVCLVPPVLSSTAHNLLICLQSGPFCCSYHLLRYSTYRTCIRSREPTVHAKQSSHPLLHALGQSLHALEPPHLLVPAHCRSSTT